MDYTLMLSLRLYLSSNMIEAKDVQIIYDGNTLSNREKPFVTIESLQTNESLSSAGRNSYEEVHHYQVGLFATDGGERMKLAEVLRTHLRSVIPVYTESGLETDTSFVCGVSAFTPLTNGDGENETNNHRGYFDVSVRLFRKNGESEFTQ